METERCHPAKRPKRLPAERAEQTVGIVFNHRRTTNPRAMEDGFHSTRDARIVHGHDHFGFLSDGFREVAFVEVKGVRANVREYGPRATEYERVGS